MKRLWTSMLASALLLTGCGASAEDTALPETLAGTAATTAAAAGAVSGPDAPRIGEDAVRIRFENGSVAVDYSDEGEAERDSVRIGGDIVCYEAGHDFSYGEGTSADAHTREEAQAHTGVTITRPGVYALSGAADAAQVAVDLGEGAKDDPDAVVTLVLDGLDLTCGIAPAIIFYNVYECGDPEAASQSVDTSAAGANIYIADGTENFISGSYVAGIYDPETVALSGDGTEVASGELLHEYDAAVWSEMSMNVTGNTGVLNIRGENEGLGSGLHLTVNGGGISIVSGNDGINTNCDGASVTTVNGGRLNITVDGATGEGDGIDSNGWIVINGGTVVAAACGTSADGGIDADMGISINGGTVIATGNMLDRISGGTRNYAVFQFSETQAGGSTYTLKNSDDKPVLNTTPVNDFTCLVLAGEGLTAGDYTLWRGETMLRGTPGQADGMGGQRPEGMEPPEGGQPPEKPEGMEPPEGMMPPDGPQEPPDGKIPADMTPPEGTIPPEEMDFADEFTQFEQFPAGPSEVFTIGQGGNFFSNITAATEG